jgi:hypothetical protein
MTLPRISDPGNRRTDFQLRLAGHPETIGWATLAAVIPRDSGDWHDYNAKEEHAMT